MDNVRLKGFTFAQIPMWLLACSDVDPLAKVIYGYLVWRQGRNAKCWPSVDRIAEDLQISRASVLRHLARLEELQYIQISRTSGKENEYTVDGDPPQKATLTERMTAELRLSPATTSGSEPVSSTLPVEGGEQTSITSATGAVAPVILDQCRARHPNYIQEPDTATIDIDGDEAQLPPNTRDGVPAAETESLRAFLAEIHYSEMNAFLLAETCAERGLVERDVRAWWAHIREHNAGRSKKRIRDPLGFLRAKIESGDRLPEARVRELLPFVGGEEEGSPLAPLDKGGVDLPRPADAPAENAGRSTSDELVWERVLAELGEQVNRTTFQTWVKPTRAVRVDGHWEVQCRNELARDWIEGRIGKMVKGALERAVGETVAVEFVTGVKE